MKHSAIAIADRLGVMKIARAVQRSRAVIVTYHGVLAHGGDEYDFLNHNFIPAERFDRQIAYLREHYRPIALSELQRAYSRGQTPPARSVAISFDDGFANNFSAAYPILRRHGIPFTIFLATGMIGRSGAQLWTERVKRAIYLCPDTSVTIDWQGRTAVWQLTSRESRAHIARTVLAQLKREPIAARDGALALIERVCGRPELGPDDAERFAFLTWPQVKDMASAGVEFGSHTVQHPILTSVDDERLDRELRESKRDVEEAIGRTCEMFAYPNGSRADFGEREKRAVERAGYTCAFALGGRLNGPRPPRYEIDRINVGRHLDGPLFQAATVGVLGAARRVRQCVVAVAAQAFSRTARA